MLKKILMSIIFCAVFTFWLFGQALEEPEEYPYETRKPGSALYPLPYTVLGLTPAHLDFFSIPLRSDLYIYKGRRVLLVFPNIQVIFPISPSGFIGIDIVVNGGDNLILPTKYAVGVVPDACGPIDFGFVCNSLGLFYKSVLFNLPKVFGFINPLSASLSVGLNGGIMTGFFWELDSQMRFWEIYGTLELSLMRIFLNGYISLVPINLEIKGLLRRNYWGFDTEGVNINFLFGVNILRFDIGI